MRYFKCDRCKFGGTRIMVRAHLREEHLIRKKKSLWCHSYDEKGNKIIYSQQNDKD